MAAAFAATVPGKGIAAAPSVSIILDPGDATAAAGPSRWAAGELVRTLQRAGVTANLFERPEQAPEENFRIIAAGADSTPARELLRTAKARFPSVPEALGLVPGKLSGKAVLLACGTDPRGLTYALLELADRVQTGTDPIFDLTASRPVIEQPANAIRSVTRMFVSDAEDKPWYNDRAMWPAYLTHLASQRFNRFQLAFGIGYDFLRNVTDAYFLFAYPFLFPVPGYEVRAAGLADSERDSNFEMLKFIGSEAAARGLHFQLGIWMHGYEWLDSPKPNFRIEGLTRDNHGPYCRDALTLLLKECPSIQGVTFRIHGESGVAEGNYDFWRTVFEGVAKCGRKVEIDMHAKGMDQGMIDVALGTGMPVNISPKYWAEHLGLPYHQAEIRELERPKPGGESSGLMKLSAGSRSFLRYGYGDLLRQDRKYGVLHRIWPGTQRLLIWGDPMTGAAYGRAFGFCGSAGADLMEPMSFKGRRGSGIAGDRCGYADTSLRPHWDWEKYRYTLRVWGRLLFNPDSDPDTWRRWLRKQFAKASEPAEEALANASRILPLITTAHGPSAANNTYWVEMYTNQPIVDPNRTHPYTDTPSPRVFGNVSPFDPQLFLTVNEFAAELLEGKRSGKYSPVEVAQWIENYSEAAARNFTLAGELVVDRDAVEWRRLVVDLSMQIGLGRFYAAKLRAGVLYGIFERSGDRKALEQALITYRRARESWAGLAGRATDIYAADITVGGEPFLRGHWLDRIPEIEADIQDMEGKLEGAGEPNTDRARFAVEAALGRPGRPLIPCRHEPPAGFRRGEALPVEITCPDAASARLIYRHVTQAERFAAAEMTKQGTRHRAVIPAEYTNSVYPLQYYFELRQGPEAVTLFPGFGTIPVNQPYFVLESGKTTGR